MPTSVSFDDVQFLLTRLEELIQEAKSVAGQEFLTLMRHVESIFKHERSAGEQGDSKIEEGLVHVPPHGTLTVVGDIHGDLESLTWILRDSEAIEKMEEGQRRILFLGDYGDRGDKSPEVYYVVLRLKAAFPGSVILLRGNHEGPMDLQAVPYDLPHQLRDKFRDQSRLICEELPRLFEGLHHAAILEQKYLFLHGGVPSLVGSLGEIARANLTHPATSHLEEILWSDPYEDMEGTAPSPRGAGKIFGENVTSRILSLVNVRTLIRGHEPCQNGASVSHSGMILTVFSRKGFPYGNMHAAYLDIDITEPARSAYDLSGSALRF